LYVKLLWLNSSLAEAEASLAGADRDVVAKARGCSKKSAAADGWSS